MRTFLAMTVQKKRHCEERDTSRICVEAVSQMRAQSLQSEDRHAMCTWLAMTEKMKK